MVFTTVCNLIRKRGPDEFWRKRRVFKLAAHYVGRRRNCYSIAIKNVHRALNYIRFGRKLKKDDITQLWQTRVEGGCGQYGITEKCFREGLFRSNILLNKKMLADLAIWEPRSFESLVKIGRERAVVENIPEIKETSTPNYVLGIKRILSE